MDKIFSFRLVLRKIEEEDLPLISGWSQLETAYGNYLSAEMISLEDCRIKFKNNYFWNDKSKTYIIELKDKKPIGTIHFWVNRENENLVVVSLKIADATMRGKGYGTEAQKCLIKHLFDNNPKYQKIEMYTDIDNIPEQRCLAKLGFTFVDTVMYDDMDKKRAGNLYRLTLQDYSSLAVYKYYDEYK